MARILLSLVAVLGAGLVAPQLPSSPNPVPGQAQAPPSAGAEPGPREITDPSYKIDATLVSVDVTVTDDEGRVLTGLRRGNFRVLDNGSPQKISSLAPTSAPITIVVLMEYSAASYGYFAGKAAEWGTAFLGHLEPSDWMALVTFDLRSKVAVDFTHNQYEVRDAIASLGFPQFSEANLYDALEDTLDKLDRIQGRKSVLLLSSGVNSFSAANFDDIRARLRRTGATVFCVGLGEAEYLRYGGTNISYVQGKNALSSFAKQTGGLAFFPRFQGELPTIFRSVTGLLRSRYTLTFRPPRESRDGRYHRLKVEIIGPDGKPLKVTDEKGKRHKIEVFAREGYMAPKG